MNTETIYYLTGRGGELDKGVGRALLDMRYQLSGREMSGTFDLLSIQNQIDLITQDLLDGFWHSEAKVIAVSYGAYLLLHTLSALKPYPGKILLLSPVLGGVINKIEMRYFSPPRADKLMSLAEKKEFPIPNEIEFHIGEHDWQCPFKRVVDFSEAVKGKCHVVPDTGHKLGKEYVTLILNRCYG